ncbi:unnamed protein product [Toxocara canis]|uniref:Major facilitator superfamily (MFS) profile domain-containing protein n=1 Tax=Toxocara canis TaxID=6265 RepID=A0A3P7HBX9_TOXCA|nr:unnamed protein product [Toxocara canis]
MYSYKCVIDLFQVEGSLIWPKSVQGSVLSAFFWGYLCSQVLGGYLAAQIGGKIVIAGTVISSALLTLISPIAATTDVYIFFAVRVALGFVQGAVFPAFHTMWSMWAPPLERSLLTGITYAGAQIGNTLVMPLSGLLCKYGFAGGWPSIYYVLGVAGLMWSAVWIYFVSDVPANNRRISSEERAYIESSLADIMSHNSNRKVSGFLFSVFEISTCYCAVLTKAHSGDRSIQGFLFLNYCFLLNVRYHFVRDFLSLQKRAVPWRSILTSVPVWATYCGHFAGDWGAYMMMTSLPLFMNDVLGFDLTSLGFLSAIPYLAYFIFINLGGVAADKIGDSGLLSTIAVRRLAMLTALGSQALFLIASGYCGCGQEALVILFLTLGIGISGVQYAGFVVNYLDIAPTFAGPILGIGNTLSCVAGILCPLMVGALTPTGSKEEWQMVFWVTGAILLGGALIFSFFAKGEVLPWALAEPSKAEEQELNPMNGNENVPLSSNL